MRWGRGLAGGLWALGLGLAFVAGARSGSSLPDSAPDRDGVKAIKEENDDNDGAEEKKFDSMEAETTKRPMSSTDATNNDDDPEQDTQESPTKRNKLAEEGE